MRKTTYFSTLTQRVAILLLSSLIASQARANQCSTETAFSCNSPCSTYDVRIQAGVEPIQWRHRGSIDAHTVTDNILPFLCVPKFSALFNTPWTIGGQIGYAWKDCIRFFFEANYAQAKAHSECKTSFPFINDELQRRILNLSINNYRFVDAYFGAQYHVGYVCDVRLSLGAKLGLIHHFRNNVSMKVTLPTEEPPRIQQITKGCPALFNKNTSFTGGGSLNLDYQFCSNWHLGFNAEIVANRGPNSNCFIPLNPEETFGVDYIIIGPIKTELRFPITASLRYTF